MDPFAEPRRVLPEGDDKIEEGPSLDMSFRYKWGFP